MLVDDDPVLDGEPGTGGKLDPGLDSEPCKHDVRLELAAVFRRDAHHAARALDPGDGRACENIDALLAVIVGDERGQIGRKDASADPWIRKDHRHRAAVHRERRGDLRADEPASDHEESRVARSKPAESPVVVEGSEVDHLVAAVGQTARRSAGREQEALVAVGIALVVGRLMSREVERDDRAPELELDAEVGGATPDRVFVVAFPERFRQRRASVGREGLVADNTNRPVGIAFADALAGGVGGQAAADDQVPVRLQGSLLVTPLG